MAYYTVQHPGSHGAAPQGERAPRAGPGARRLALERARRRTAPTCPIDLLPRHLIDAVIATEDRRFFKHWGLDPTGMLRAAFTNLRAGRVAQGGSTLTQQLAKNLFLGSERTYARKLEELVLALWLELRLGKRNILELYLNRVYFGAGAYGVDTASQRFFGKSAREVSACGGRGAGGPAQGAFALLAGFQSAGCPGARRRRAGQDGGGAPPDGGGERQGRPRDAALLRGPGSAGSRASTTPSTRCWSSCRRWSASRRATSSSRPPSTRNLQRRAQALVQSALAGEGQSARASQAGLVHRRPGGRHQGGGRRALVCGEPVQSRAQGETTAGLRLQDVRLPGRARERPQARQHGPGPADPRARAGARATRARAIAAP